MAPHPQFTHPCQTARPIPAPARAPTTLAAIQLPKNRPFLHEFLTSQTINCQGPPTRPQQATKTARPTIRGMLCPNQEGKFVGVVARVVASGGIRRRRHAPSEDAPVAQYWTRRQALRRPSLSKTPSYQPNSALSSRTPPPRCIGFRLFLDPGEVPTRAIAGGPNGQSVSPSRRLRMDKLCTLDKPAKQGSESGGYAGLCHQRKTMFHGSPNRRVRALNRSSP